MKKEHPIKSVKDFNEYYTRKGRNKALPFKRGSSGNLTYTVPLSPNIFTIF